MHLFCIRKKPLPLTTMLIWQYYGNLLRRTLLKKGPSSNSSPKTFILNFAPMGCSQEREILTLVISGEYPIGAKFGLKVFGKGSGEEPFFRKVLPQQATQTDDVNTNFRFVYYTIIRSVIFLFRFWWWQFVIHSVKQFCQEFLIINFID